MSEDDEIVWPGSVPGEAPTHPAVTVTWMVDGDGPARPVNARPEDEVIFRGINGWLR